MSAIEDVVILGGGRGARLQAHAPSIPKPRVEIGGRRILWHVIPIYAAKGYAASCWPRATRRADRGVRRGLPAGPARATPATSKTWSPGLRSIWPRPRSLACSRIGWDTVGRIVKRVVADHLDERRLDGLVQIGVDEISYRRHHRYLTSVVDHQAGAIVWCAPGRNAATLQAFFDELERRHTIRAVSIDMSGGYEKAIRENVPKRRDRV
jgi:hypothetical protein